MRIMSCPTCGRSYAPIFILPKKVVQINDDIDRMRHSATRSLLERRDVIVVASVSVRFDRILVCNFVFVSTPVDGGGVDNFGNCGRRFHP